MSKARLIKHPADRVWAGVCAGLAAWFGLDPVVLRLVWLVWAVQIDTSTAFLAYIALMIVMPEAPRDEREAAKAMLVRHPRAKTLGADRAYDTHDFVAALRSTEVTPHVAQNLNRRGGSAIDARTTRHEGYDISQCIRKRVEEPFGWGKTVGPIRQTKFRGRLRVAFQFVMTMAGYNLILLRRLLAPPLPA